MKEWTRRDVLGAATGLGVSAALGNAGSANAQDVRLEKREQFPIRADELMMDLLETNEGLFIGEEHVAGRPEFTLLADNLQKLYDVGIRLLGLEAFDAEDQILIDNYYREQSEENRNKLVRACIFGEHGGERFISLIERSRTTGIYVAGIDVKARHSVPNDLSRKDVNTKWAENVKNARTSLPKASKYIVFGGLNHSRSGVEREGVNQILDIPSIIPADPNKYPSPHFGFVDGYTVVGRDGRSYLAVDVESFENLCANMLIHYTTVMPDMTKREQYQTLHRLILGMNSATVQSKKNAIAAIVRRLSQAPDTLSEKEGLRQLLQAVSAK